MTNKYNIKGEVAVVTGGASGIGKGIVKNLLISGAKVATIGRSEESLKSLFKEFKDLGEIIYIPANVKNHLEVKDAFKKIIEKWGKVNILVNNAGITDDKLAIRMTEESWNEVIDINLKGTFNCIKNALPNMIKNKSGKIINITSVVGHTGNVGQANYAASKSGIIGMSKSLALEYAKKNININCISPGFIKTNMTEKIDPKFKELILAKIPSNRLGEPSDVANVAAFLSSEMSNYITGETIHVNGGMYLG